MTNSKPRVLISGNKGMLGRDLTAVLSSEFAISGVDIGEMDITQPSQIAATLDSVKPQIIINSAAYTKVDDCETNAELACRINGEAVANLARAAAERNIYFIHFSTDYVFDGQGTRPYLENDPVNPNTVYGRSKLLGEEAVKTCAKKWLLIRTAWLYGEHGPNFVDTMLRLAGEVKLGNRRELKIVDDQWGSPTYTMDLSRAVKYLIQKNVTGLIHMTNQGICTWHDFAVEIIKLAGISDVPVLRIKSDEIARPAKRPLYSVLSKDRLEKECGYHNRPWQEALIDYLQNSRKS